jgi:hypothetical protein
VRNPKDPCSLVSQGTEPEHSLQALRQFVTKAFSATPELAFLAGSAAGGNDIGVYKAALRASAKLTLTQRSYDTLQTQAAATRNESNRTQGARHPVAGAGNYSDHKVADED